MRSFAAVIILCIGCFAPHPDNGKLLCGSHDSCPDGYQCLAGACWLNGTDLAASSESDGGDLGIADSAAEDQSSPNVDLRPVVVTANDINTGKVANLTEVTVNGLVVTAPVILNSKNAAMLKCRYEGFLQDPNGATPNGAHIFVALANCDPAGLDGGDCWCPAAGATGTPLDDLVTLGDVVSVTGTYSLFNGTIHELGPLSAVSRTGTNGSVNPLLISDPTSLGPTHSGFVTYESMLVRIEPASPFTISALDGAGNFSGAGVAFSGVYRPVYGMGGSFPPSGSTWHAITGVVNNFSTGTVEPRIMNDFTP